MKTLVTLDFDGVISPLHPDMDADFRSFRLSGFDVDVRQKVLDFLSWLSESDADVVWASSWDDLMDSFEEDSGGSIPSFPHLRIPNTASKPKAILDAVKSGAYTRVVVVEDDRDLAKTISDALPSSVVVIPKTTRGLSDREISYIKRYLSGE